MLLQAEVSRSVKERIHLRHIVETGKGLQEKESWLISVVVVIQEHNNLQKCADPLCFCYGIAVKYLNGACNVEALLHPWNVQLKHTQIFALDGDCPGGSRHPAHIKVSTHTCFLLGWFSTKTRPPILQDHASRNIECLQQKMKG